MNKLQFLKLLRSELGTMPIKEQNELLEDYETHYAFGQQEGKTEEEISIELGDPLQLAVEAIEEYHRNYPLNSKPTATRSRTILSIVGLFMLNFVLAVVPLGISIWAVWVCLFVSSAIFVITPVLALFDFIIHSYFVSGKLFASLMLSGVGILLVIGVIYVGKMLRTISISYYNWNVRVIRGGK